MISRRVKGADTMADQYRAEQIGSLLRPTEVMDARATHAQGSITIEQLREVEDRAIIDALEMQRQVGVDIFSDGEFRRSWFSAAFADSIEGIVDDPDAVFVSSWQGEQGELADQVAADIGFAEQMVGADRAELDQPVVEHSDTGLLKGYVLDAKERHAFGGV